MQNAQKYVSDTRALVVAHQRHWGAIAREGIVTYSWLHRFAKGDYLNPGVLTLQAVRDAIERRVTAECDDPNAAPTGSVGR